MYKKCSKCKVEKPLVEFYKDKYSKSGYKQACKTCTKEYYENNKQRVLIQQVSYRIENKTQIAAQKLKYYEVNKEQKLEYYLVNKDKILDRCAKYRINNKEKIDEYRSANKGKFAEYKIVNRDKYNSYAARRRANKLQATPSWLTAEEFEQIIEFYTCAQMFKLYTGQDYHVDHIVPLQGKTVCGLHVPWNLQVIPAKENRSKSNRLLEE